MAEYNDQLCREMHKRLDEKVDVHERRINNHSERIDQLEQHRSRTETKIESLCEQIGNLITTIRWLIGLFLGAFVSFFFWYIQGLGG